MPSWTTTSKNSLLITNITIFTLRIYDILIYIHAVLNMIDIMRAVC